MAEVTVSAASPRLAVAAAAAGADAHDVARPQLEPGHAREPLPAAVRAQHLDVVRRSLGSARKRPRRVPGAGVRTREEAVVRAHAVVDDDRSEENTSDLQS